MRSLAEAQARIRAAIIEGEAAAAVPLLVGGHDPATRLAIHQRHYQTSLVTALLAKFPAVEWLAGTPFVTAAAQEFVRRRAPTSPCIAEYGEDFPDFMADRPGAGRMPYLRWFGHLEWHLGQVALAIERPSLPAHVLAGLAPEALPDVVLRVQPGLRYLEAPWPVDDVMTLFLTEAAPERYVLDPIGVSLEIRGARGTFAMTRLDAGAFAFRRGIMEGRPIAAAAEGALAADPAFEPGRALRALFADGLVTAVTSAQRGDTW